MKLRIKYMYENSDTQMLDLILNSKSITEFLNKAEYITELSQYDRNMLDKFKKTRQTIADSKQNLKG
ncbi:MAG: coiled-coil domain-containing protein [Eubacterium sp.]